MSVTNSKVTSFNLKDAVGRLTSKSSNLPRISSSKSDDLVDSNLWKVCIPVEYSSKIITTSSGLNGNIRNVPTVSSKISYSDISTKNTNNNGNISTSQIMDLAQRCYNYRNVNMSNSVTDISNNIKNLTEQFIPRLMVCPTVSGYVSIDTFNNALEIYENNQCYYQYCNNNNIYNEHNISIYLSTLEWWFLLIIEHSPLDHNDNDEWKDRECFKISNGHSYYCDSDLYKFIKPPSEDILVYIKNIHTKIF
jgi:hypothetical protein